ncbi:MAG: hypothetical protein V4805_19125 [Pseudomonadota bacterium]
MTPFSFYKNSSGIARMLAASVLLSLSACKPAEPPPVPPDLLKTQREALEKAKALEGQMKQQLNERMKSVDENEQK